MLDTLMKKSPNYNIMKIRLRMVKIIILMVMQIACVNKALCQDMFSIYKNIDCGSLHAKSYTVAYIMIGESEQFKNQTIEIRPKSHHSFIKLNLEQHFSVRKSLHGKAALDDIATSWFCRPARNGKQYLWIGLDCSWDAESCEDTSERAELYDQAGHNLHLDRMSHAQAHALFTRLEIPHEPPEGGYITDRHKISH